MIALLYLAFFLSGAAALAYESVWTRYLGLLVGHDAYAQVVVLVIFLGGMSLGAALTARHTAKVSRPLVAYALVEALVGVLALLFHDVFQGTSALAYSSLFPVLAGGALLGPAKWIVAALLILPQSVLLGTTFPLMSAGILRLRPAEPGRVLSWLYFTNSLGGAVGVLLAGFVLVELAGLPGTLIAAGALNLVVALIAMVVGRRGSALSAVGTPAAVAEAPRSEATTVAPRLLLAVAFGTAVASFAYEIDWIRMLSLVLGSATHSFELMLSAFILGLAIGAIAVRRLDSLRSPLRLLGWVQVAMGTLAVLTLPVYVASFDWMASLLATFTRTDAGYTGFSIVRYGICLAVMLPSTICAGMTLPLITRSLLVSGQGESAIGKVYAWNTLGSIVGVSLAALVLLPGVGLKPMLLLAGALDVALGLVIFTALGSTRRAAAAGLAAAAVMGIVALRVPLEQRLLVSGVFRRGTVDADRDATLRFYRDGRTATVALGENSTGSRWISTNGKSDASLGPWWQAACTDTMTRRRLGGDEITQILLPLVTQAYRPDARRAAVVGFGSGMSSHILLSQPALREVTTIEIEPQMVRGAMVFRPANARVYDDPRSRIVLRDAKAHFAASATTWDVILSEPSNPWVSGVSGLFTEEFYQRVSAALESDGVFGQWLHSYEITDELVLGVLASIDRVFPAWRVHQVGSGDLLVVATPAQQLPPLRSDLTLSSAALQEDLCRFGAIAPSDLAATVLAEAELLRPVLAQIGQPNSDFYPTLDLGAERARFRQASAAGMMALGYDWYNLGQALLDAPGMLTVAGELAFDDLALVRESWVRDRVDSLVHAENPHVQAALAHVRSWTAFRESPAPPPNWLVWLNVHGAASKVVHAGMAGTVDSRFFDEAVNSARRLGAGEDVLTVLRFRRAVQGWDAAGTLAASHRLLADSVAGRLLSIDEVRDGAVVMALRSDDRELAARYFHALASGSQRGTNDLRTLLLQVRVQVAGTP